MNPQITALYGAILALLYIILAYRVARARMRHKTGLGSGGHATLEQAIRVHGNFSEYVPLALVLLLLLELNHLPVWALHVHGGALVAGRLLHAYGLTQSTAISFGRFYGTLATWLMMVSASIILLVRQVV